MASPCSPPPACAFVPPPAAEKDAHGWNDVDVVFAGGDACIDDPSLATALPGLASEARRHRVAAAAAEHDRRPAR